MRTALTFLLASSITSGGWMAFGAEAVIEGTVALPPPPRMSRDVSARYKLKSGTVVQPEKPTAVVYLEGRFPPARASNSERVKLVQNGYQFSPSLLPVLTNTTVEFPNQDADYHHVFSYSKPNDFDLGRYRKDEKSPTATFDKPGAVLIGCEIHEHMQAVVLVLDTPHFVRTDAEGAYRLVLEGVPDGDYKLRAWVDPRDVREQTVNVKDGATVRVDFPGK